MKTPAPRYSRPIPPSTLPPVTTPTPAHRLDRAPPPHPDEFAHAWADFRRELAAPLRSLFNRVLDAFARERSDRMLRIGVGMGLVAVLFAVMAVYHG